ncbi:class I SAM-dependent methyltransferase [Novispirillum sp. DQ9]|uniref:class I SAM-dependent methyltransferase n=1 Tax=Novispirillum sp. DQ9 TaxID=3398612 RepID=UPI003C7A5FF8
MTQPDEPRHRPAAPASPSFAAELGRVLFPGETALDPATLAHIAATYDETLRRAGPTPNSVLWHDRPSQVVRFRKLLKVLGPDARTRGLVINDLGCGYGALFAYLRRKRVLRGGRYFGYDLSPDMVAAAARLHRRDPRATFVHASEATEEADFSFASGTYGLMLDANRPAWEAWVRDSLRRLAAKSRRGLAFNMLDARGPDDRHSLYYADPAATLAFCREELGARARIIDTYTPYDFTILCRFDGVELTAGRAAPRRITWWNRWLPFL